MKFAYIDESGSTEEGDVFVMAGLLIDAYRLRKYTCRFDQDLTAFMAKHPGAPNELKTKAFINGRGGWNKVAADDRKQFLTDTCALAAEVSSIYGFGMSFERFNAACASGAYTTPCASNYWALNGMFVSGLIQKKVQGKSNNKGLTVLIFDDNKAHMPKVSDGLYLAEPWFDAIYQPTRKVKGKNQWGELKQPDRFGHIINTAFAIKSQHSSLVQVADAVSYVYRRHLELTAQPEAWAGEQALYSGLIAQLDAKRERLGRTPDAEYIDFYNAVKHPAWAL
jgi:hypothetical protein